ncbi:hypothetical protein A2881_04970 [Candidatus Peribacteria bacterium RIFCSPHIGHO2_01_FULL_55_13]|nr:MAG: hypothetical protein A2881_04970 [Candidatus Peribacteria bacterium RIFCSPHIGHO2_01_FULL_55_13]OGJ64876.1 MAG: hypothetical protein A3F36_00445 [Candidatus Peribacteria bacterium RIFCSPHIGHO2_12_FULL_55_11]
MTSRLLRSSLALAAFVLATPAFAASITVDQRSDVAIFGTWNITPPTGSQIHSFGREQRRVIGNLPAGMYTFDVKPPAGATTTIRLIENSVTLQSVTDDRISFTMADTSSYTVQVAYTYQGRINVESIPTGAPFELTAPNGIRFTGVAPETFRDLPPAYYSVHFGLRSGCNVPRPIQRNLGTNEEVTFLGEYRCGFSSSPALSSVEGSSASRVSSSSRSASVRSSSSSSSTVARARVLHVLQQGEALPGGTIRVTVGFVNTSRSTLEDLTLSETFDPYILSVSSVPAGAYVQGNTIFWRIPRVYAGQRWSDNVLFAIAENAPTGETMLKAELDGTALDGASRDQLSDTAVLGVATLPATGGAFDVLLSFLGLLLPAPVLARIRRK